MGGTFMSQPVEYRNWFISNMHDALSGNRSTSLKEAIRYEEVVVVVVVLMYLRCLYNAVSLLNYLHYIYTIN